MYLGVDEPLKLLNLIGAFIGHFARLRVCMPSLVFSGQSETLTG
jgi:hypothetical protein